MSPAFTFTPSSWRRRFSKSTLMEYGSRSTPKAASASQRSE